MQLKLNTKDAVLRETILFKPLLKTVIVIALPLMMFNALNSLFSVFDTFMAAHIGGKVVSSVAYLNQIKSMIAALGAGISLAGSMLIAKYIGAHDLKLVKSYVNTMFFIAGSIGLTILVVVIFTSESILILLGMPEELIETSLRYFHLEMITLLMIFLNQVYIAIEKAKGNSRKIFKWNMIVVIIKLGSSFVFVYLMNKGIEWLAIASILAQASLTIAGTYQIFREKGVFGFDYKYIVLKKSVVLPLFTLALPIFMEKFVFSFGKVFVNSMSTVYGSLAIGALGVSNNISGLITNPALGIQEAEASIVSQNVGFGQTDRGFKTFFYAVIINGAFGLLGTGFLFLFMTPIVNVFAGTDEVFALLIRKIFRYEALAIPLLTITASCMGFLYGMGKTKLTMLLNMVRLLGYRIPALYILIHVFKLGPESLGLAMMISNGLIGITAFITVAIFMKASTTK